MNCIRFVIPIAVALVLLVTPLSAQEMKDVVYLKDGSRIVGTILEIIPDSSIMIRASDGIVHHYGWERLERIVKEEVPDADGRKGLESWYGYFSLGFAINSHPDELQAFLDLLKNQPEATHTPIAIEILGFYWPLRDDRTLLGFIVSGTADRYISSGIGRQVNQYLYAFSSMHFFDEVPGDGPFIRGDVGLAVLSDPRILEFQSGVGFLAGGGYGIPVSDGFRILLQSTFSYRSIKGGAYTTFSFSAGGLF